MVGVNTDQIYTCPRLGLEPNMNFSARDYLVSKRSYGLPTGYNDQIHIRTMDELHNLKRQTYLRNIFVGAHSLSNPRIFSSKNRTLENDNAVGLNKSHRKSRVKAGMIRLEPPKLPVALQKQERKRSSKTQAITPIPLRNDRQLGELPKAEIYDIPTVQERSVKIKEKTFHESFDVKPFFKGPAHRTFSAHLLRQYDMAKDHHNDAPSAEEEETEQLSKQLSVLKMRETPRPEKPRIVTFAARKPVPKSAPVQLTKTANHRSENLESDAEENADEPMLSIQGDADFGHEEPELTLVRRMVDDSPIVMFTENTYDNFRHTKFKGAGHGSSVRVTSPTIKARFLRVRIGSARL